MTAERGTADCKKLIAIMALGVKRGDTITLSCEEAEEKRSGVSHGVVLERPDGLVLVSSYIL